MSSSPTEKMLRTPRSRYTCVVLAVTAVAGTARAGAAWTGLAPNGNSIDNASALALSHRTTKENLLPDPMVRLRGVIVSPPRRKRRDDGTVISPCSLMQHVRATLRH